MGDDVVCDPAPNSFKVGRGRHHGNHAVAAADVYFGTKRDRCAALSAPASVRDRIRKVKYYRPLVQHAHGVGLFFGSVAVILDKDLEL